MCDKLICSRDCSCESHSAGCSGADIVTYLWRIWSALTVEMIASRHTAQLSWHTHTKTCIHNMDFLHLPPSTFISWKLSWRHPPTLTQHSGAGKSYYQLIWRLQISLIGGTFNKKKTEERAKTSLKWLKSFFFLDQEWIKWVYILKWVPSSEHTANYYY